MLSGHIHWSFIYYIKVNIGLFILRTRFPANYTKGHVTVSSCLPELICQSQISGACRAGAEGRDIQKDSENGGKETADLSVASSSLTGKVEAGLIQVLGWGGERQRCCVGPPQSRLRERSVGGRLKKTLHQCKQAALLLTPKSQFKAWIRRFYPLAKTSSIVLL